MSQQNRRQACIGFTMVEMVTSLAILSILAALVLPSILAARDRTRSLTCSSHLRQIGIALAGYEVTYGMLPVGLQGLRTHGHSYHANADVFSVHARLLPFLDAQKTYNKIDFREHVSTSVNRLAMA